jgi:hypothetical protein
MLSYALTALVSLLIGIAIGKHESTRTGRMRLSTFNALTPTQTPKREAWSIGEWELNLQAFALYGDMCNFSRLTMCYEWRVVTEPGWKVYLQLLDDIGAIHRAERMKTRWRAGWGVRNLRMVIKHQAVVIPYPNKPAWAVSGTRQALQVSQAPTPSTESEE